ncbi:MAG: hypothetical protein GY898_26295 [Proteobacteria bacterium]|nr:hypothetical protein [Pseudomonadota bacterium]
MSTSDVWTTDRVADRVRQELARTPTADALGAAARELRDAGVGQALLYDGFTVVLVEAQDDEVHYDAIADTLDCIHSGPWAKGRALFAGDYEELRTAAEAAGLPLIAHEADLDAADRILALPSDARSPFDGHLLDWSRDTSWPVAQRIASTDPEAAR